MHSYQIDVDKRNKPLWVMCGMATIITALASGWLNSFEINSVIKNFIPAPSAFFIFLIIYWVFNNWLWQWPLFRWCFAISEPNLSGRWKGQLKSNTHNIEVDIVLNIEQHWSKISITSSFDKSTSSSFSAAILCSKALPVLIYNYHNTPFYRKSDTMTRHIGTVELTLKNAQTLVGNYFNSGDRKSEGSIIVSKIK
jgi:hypothetical protein